MSGPVDPMAAVESSAALPSVARWPGVALERERTMALLGRVGPGAEASIPALEIDSAGALRTADSHEAGRALLEVLLRQCARGLHTLGVAAAIHVGTGPPGRREVVVLVDRLSARLREMAIPIVGLEIVPGPAAVAEPTMDLVAIGRRSAPCTPKPRSLWLVEVGDTIGFGGPGEILGLLGAARTCGLPGDVGFVAGGRDPVGDLRIACAVPGQGARFVRGFLEGLVAGLRPDAQALILAATEIEVTLLRDALGKSGLSLRQVGATTGGTGLEGDGVSSSPSLAGVVESRGAEAAGAAGEASEGIGARLSDLPEPADYEAALLDLVGLPWLASPMSLWDRCDRFPGLHRDPAADAGAVLVDARGDEDLLVLALAAAPRAALVDPYLGACIAVADVARRLAARGAEAETLSVCINAREPVLGELALGLRDAARALGARCLRVGWAGAAGRGLVLADPLVAGAGRVAREPPAPWIPRRDEIVVLLGRNREEFGASEMAGLRAPELLPTSLPWVDFGAERRVAEVTRAACAAGMVSAAQAVGAGGLARALVALAVGSPPQVRPIGLSVRVEQGMRPDGFLFGESQARIVVVVPAQHLGELREIAQRCDVPLLVLGETGGDTLRIAGVLSVELGDLQRRWRSALAPA